MTDAPRRYVSSQSLKSSPDAHPMTPDEHVTMMEKLQRNNFGDEVTWC
jgi:hypothetical protein